MLLEWITYTYLSFSFQMLALAEQGPVVGITSPRQRALLRSLDMEVALRVECVSRGDLVEQGAFGCFEEKGSTSAPIQAPRPASTLFSSLL